MIFVALALLAIAFATLWPVSGYLHQWSFCLACGDRGTSDLLRNIALFIPLGAALALRRQPRSFIIVFGVLLSSAMELSQLYIPGRAPTLGDIVANTLGTILGVLAVQSAHLWLSPSTTLASWLCRAATLTAALICLTTGLLLSPSFPASRSNGLRNPEPGHVEWHRGRVLEADVGSTQIRPGPLPRHVRELLQSRAGYELRVRALAGSQTPGLAPLLAIIDERGREILLLGVDRDELVLRIRMRAAAWRFDNPDLRVAAPPHVRSGDTLLVNVAAQAGRYSINGVDRGFTVGNGWALLGSFEPLPLKQALSAVWIGALFLPAGFWWRTRKDGVIVALGLLSGLLLVPALTPLVLTPLLQWLAAGLGLGAGARLRRWGRLPTAAPAA